MNTIIFKNTKIGTRLFSGFLLVFIVLTSVAVFGISRMTLLSNQTVMMYRHPLAISNAVLRINTQHLRIHHLVENIALAKSPDEIRDATRTINQIEKEVYKNFEIIDERFLGEKALYSRALQAFVDWRPIRDEVVGLMRDGRRGEAASISKGKGARHVLKVTQAMGVLGDFAEKEAMEFLDEAASTKKSAMSSMYLMLTLTMLAGTAFVVFLTRSITRPVEMLHSATKRLGRGETGIRIELDSGGEIGKLADAFNRMSADLDTAREVVDHELNERGKAEEQIKRSLDEKERLLKEVHHRVKNNLQVISGLLQIQSRAVRKSTGVSVEEVLEDSRNRIKSMAVIHDLIHRSDDLASVDIRRCIDVVGKDLVKAYDMSDRVEWSSAGDKVFLGIDQAIPCSLVVNEFITNSLKHAFPGGRHGRITVTLSKDESDMVDIAVSDDGVGMDEDVDWKHPTSVGLDLVNGLVGQIDGSIELDRSMGTQFKIRFRRI